MISTIPIAKGLLVDAAGNVLILRRSQTHPTLAGQVDLPGGQIDLGEEPGAALIREIYEETGLEVNPDRLSIQYAGVELHEDTFRVRVWYVVRLTDVKPTITLSYEHESFDWLPISELPTLLPKFLGFYHAAIAHVLRYKLLEQA